MNGMYSAWDTADSAGGDLTGTMVADRASGPSYMETLQPFSPPPTPPPPAVANPESIASLGQEQVNRQMQQQEQQPFFNNLSFNQKTGTVKVEMPQGALADVMAQLTDLKQMKTAAMARVAQLQQQEASGSPLIDALSQISGHLAANDPTMPGWVRALGAANLQMGPQGIRRRREAEEAKVANLSTGIADLAMNAEKFNFAVQQAGQTNYLKAAELAQKVMEAGQPDLKEFSKLMGRVSTETRQIRQFDPETFALEAKALGATDDQIAAASDKFTSLAAMADKKYQIEKAAEAAKANREEQSKLNRQAISIGAAMDRVLASKDITAIGAAQKLDPKEESFLSAARAYDEYLRQAEDVIKKYGDVMGPVAGRVTKMNPYRSRDAEKAMQLVNTNLQRFMQSNGESIARGSDRDMKLFERAAADITSNPKNALEILQQQREVLRGKMRGVIEVNPYADWSGRYGVVLPEWGKAIKDEVLSRTASGPGMALPSGARTGGAKPPDLPADFLEFLGGLPAGKGGVYNGKTYVIQNGVPVEVK